MTLQKGQDLPDDVGVFRELRLATDIDKATGAPTTGAFIPRPLDDVEGLSLTLHAESANPYQCTAKRQCRGLADLLPSRVRGIPSELNLPPEILDPVELKVTFDENRHCLLQGIPTQPTPEHQLKNEELLLQEMIADALRAISAPKTCARSHAS